MKYLGVLNTGQSCEASLHVWMLRQEKNSLLLTKQGLCLHGQMATFSTFKLSFPLSAKMLL